MDHQLKFTACHSCGSFIKIMVDGQEVPELDNVDAHFRWHAELKKQLQNLHLGITVNTDAL